MKKSSQEQQQVQHLVSINSPMDTPLWLLQKDDRRFLYLSVLLSMAVHIILFLVLAATRIFYPLAGTSLKFDLVWLSPVTATTLKETAAPKPGLPTVRHVNEKTQLPPTTRAKSPSASNPPQTLPVAAQAQTANELKIEEPSEMVVSRFGGKVVEVVPKKREIPSFTVNSSVTARSEATQAVVQTIRETVTRILKPKISKLPTKAVETTEVVSHPNRGSSEKQNEAIAVVATLAKQPNRELNHSPEIPVQRKVSSSSIVSAIKQPIIVPVASKQSVQAEIQQVLDNGVAGPEGLSTLQVPGKSKSPPQPPSIEKIAGPEVRKAPSPQAPHLIFDSPLNGDLKLIITGDVDVKVEVFFWSFPKTRRNKPFTRREAERRRAVLSKMVRTKENVREAVIETAEEGIYSIVVHPGNDKKGTAELILKVRESQAGAATKKLGTRKIDSPLEVVKILMPEGVLWSDDSYFTGDMEDADSITKFNTETGLMWREYK